MCNAIILSRNKLVLDCCIESRIEAMIAVVNTRLFDGRERKKEGGARTLASTTFLGGDETCVKERNKEGKKRIRIEFLNGVRYVVGVLIRPIFKIIMMID